MFDFPNNDLLIYLTIYIKTLKSVRSHARNYRCKEVKPLRNLDCVESMFFW